MSEDDEGEISPGVVTETEDEEFEDDYGESTRKKKKKKKKKGNWKTIGWTPKIYSALPCECRWKAKFPKGPCIKYKQLRWIVLPLSDRVAQMALPLLRRLLALWLEYGDKFPPEMRERLKNFLMENYGLTEEFLEQIADEARKARENAGKPKEKKKKPRRRAKKKKKKPKVEEKPKKEKPEKQEPKVKEKTSGLGFKRRKAGKLPLDWPNKMGSKLILNYISDLSQDPDENFNSRATEYFDVQAMAILEQVCRFMNMPLPDPERPTQYGETIVIMALNLSNLIAKYVVAPAQEIPDDKVDEYLDLRGAVPKVKKDKKKKDVPEKGGKKNKENSEKPSEQTAVEGEPQRGWDEVKSPVYVPPKTRVSKKKSPQTDEEGYITDIDRDDEDEEGIPRWEKRTLDDVKQEFLDYLNWYNPWSPEFMYLGPKDIPDGVDMYKIRDADNDNVPDDLRVLHWTIIKYNYTDGYSFIPSPVPQYYPCLRPLRPVKLENLERSGIPMNVFKQNLRFSSPWYIMSHSLKEKPKETPADATPEGDGNGNDGSETEETFNDEILAPALPPEIRDAVWGDCKMMEQIEILFHILHLSATVPDLTIEHVFELLEEFCDAVECAELDENSSEENKLHRKKRTIILERYYFNFFGKKFRDYNDRTPYYMRTICSRLAYYIQLLYEYTARNLWELQSRPNEPSPVHTPPETPDDEQALQDWDEWIAWLLRVTKTCDEWAGWISETVEEAEKKAEKKKGEYIGPDGKVQKLTKEEWFDWKDEVEEMIHGYRSSKKLYFKENEYYLEKAKDILSVRHRPVKRYNEEEEEEEEEEGEGEYEEEEEEEEEGDWEDRAGKRAAEENAEPDREDDQETTDGATGKDETTAEETEYEDITGSD